MWEGCCVSLTRCDSCECVYVFPEWKFNQSANWPLASSLLYINCLVFTLLAEKKRCNLLFLQTKPNIHENFLSVFCFVFTCHSCVHCAVMTGQPRIAAWWENKIMGNEEQIASIKSSNFLIQRQIQNIILGLLHWPWRNTLSQWQNNVITQLWNSIRRPRDWLPSGVRDYIKRVDWYKNLRYQQIVQIKALLMQMMQNIYSTSSWLHVRSMTPLIILDSARTDGHKREWNLVFLFKEASAPVKRTRRTKKLATLSTVNSKHILHFPAKSCCALSAQITLSIDWGCYTLTNERSHFCNIYIIFVSGQGCPTDFLF